MAQDKLAKLETLSVSFVLEHVVEVKLNRPNKRNAINHLMWQEFIFCFSELIPNLEDCRVVVITGEGPVFCAGIDLGDLLSSASKPEFQDVDPARKFLRTRRSIMKIQKSFQSINECPQPVIAAVHGVCTGAGVDLISATDIRFCSEEATFCVKEVDIGLCADVGSLQFLPRIISNDGILREIALTSRNVASKEAKEIGLVSRVCSGGKEAVHKEAFEMAKLIAQKSPVAVVGTKRNLNYSRDHSISDGLEYVSTWNSGCLQTEDLVKIATTPKNSVPIFSKL